MRSLQWALGLAGVLPIACIMPPTPPPAPNRAAVPSESDVKALLADAYRARDARQHEKARDLARRGLAQAKEARVAPRTLAELHELEGNSLFLLDDPGSPESFEAALAIYEKISGAERDVARVARRLAMSLALPVIELERAEALLKRSIEITNRLEPKDNFELVFAHQLLLEVLHQRCRTADALPLIEVADALVNSARPIRPFDPLLMHRLRANLAADQGDITGAIALEKRVLDGLSRLDQDEQLLSFMGVDLDALAQLERSRGNYAESLAYVERHVALDAKRSGDDFERAVLAENLHWAYLATADPRVAEHDAKHKLVSAHAGEPMFPPKLPEKGACHPELAKPPLGALNRYAAVSERAEACLKDSERREGERIPILLRVVSGKVVAVQALGRRTERSVLRCVVDAALGYEHPTEKYNEFGFESLE